MFGVSKAPLSALSVSLKAVVLQNAVAQLRIYDVGALLVRKTVGACLLFRFKISILTVPAKKKDIRKDVLLFWFRRPKGGSTLSV